MASFECRDLDITRICLQGGSGPALCGIPQHWPSRFIGARPQWLNYFVVNWGAKDVRPS